MRIIVLCLAVLLHSPMVLAAEGVHLGVDLGMLKPHDDLVTETFAEDFFIDGFLGYESAMGLEIRLGLGHYSEHSHHPADEGFDTKISITPLHMDLFYNFFPRSKIRPFLGGGLGAYFYAFSDNVAGTIEDETVFAPSLTAGVKFEVNERLVITAKYARHFIPAIPEIMFSDPNDFESSVFTIGVAFNLTPGPEKRSSDDSDYFYSRHRHYYPPHYEPLHHPRSRQRGHTEKRKEHVRRYENREPIAQGNSRARQARREETRKEKSQRAETDQDEKQKHIDRYRNRN
ncbi:uncharacterized protein Dvar_12420 [Desulfosarcina variabilis str. Montpellier]|uniref:porin family protein n=1 Tax=Desulfosarcina variabilis TaxID=2300 RepID=UPI003AFA2C94